MIPDLTDLFARYEALRTEVDSLFSRIRQDFPLNVACKEGCSDCCHALFDLSLIEAMYLNKTFEASFGHGPQHSTILERASEADRRATRFKRNLFRSEKDGENPDVLLERAAQARLRCPLLDESDRCLMYDARPITCRVYGVPTSIAGQGHVCGFSAFEAGKAYPTVHLDKVQQRLEALSRELAEKVKTRFRELHEVYVPLSMALLTRYDAAYLGIGPAREEKA
ncbi:MULTISPECIES: YkgJ family cysteine cluster protein [unclassified Desulfovibrio]|uniref:YkgJ family cysteine cluster protein n=1 Tax=unclassified Desulfovibrio TaxID=2593640 RepID=UPI000F5F8C8E|nr:MULTISPECIES: YkgJ family cysteine cluster protein [unclassified Desulfovibrio]RRD72414.1 YkgJ family cysteine cluster protein [Desulfovibrio sp. OH1209_COT-279]RRD88525.1 YkgJ family cysteine cluster protein [Desulfovibrio sp. OH1186_COT-070]